MKQYHDLITKILTEGIDSSDRTGVGTRSIFGHQMQFDLTQGFPLLTTKRTPFKNMVDELQWMLSGSTDVNDLPKRTQHWWKPWAYEDGGLGRTYGAQFRRAETHMFEVDQLKEVINSIKTDPNSRRHIIVLWDAYDSRHCALSPCHGNHIQFYVRNGKLSCSTLQRSADVFIGLPINIAFYALLTHLIAEECNLEVDKLIYNINDAHIYLNHIDQCKELLTREEYPLPKVSVDLHNSSLLDTIDAEALHMVVLLSEYKSHPAIKASVAV